MKVKDITERMSPDTQILIHDRTTEEGTVYSGSILKMRTYWNERNVAWMKVYTNKLVLEID